jgi:hypothetical protein
LFNRRRGTTNSAWRGRAIEGGQEGRWTMFKSAELQVHGGPD